MCQSLVSHSHILIARSDAGTTTCSGFPGSLGNEALDAQTWAEWGVDCECKYISSELFNEFVA